MLTIDLLYFGPGTSFGTIGSTWTSVFLYLHPSCPLLGRDLSPGKFNPWELDL